MLLNTKPSKNPMKNVVRFPIKNVNKYPMMIECELITKESCKDEDGEQ